MIRKAGFIIVVLVLLASSSAQNAQARPSYQSSPAQVRICYTDPDCRAPTSDNTEPSPFNDYIEHVLANEWHSLAGLEALKAGAVAIRTFALREPGCGARWSYYNGVPVLNNYSQTYRFGDRNGPQNTVTANHTAARTRTDGVYLYRTDGGLACAKYDANTGNPTKACDVSYCPQPLDRDTLVETADPVDRNNVFPARTSIGMSQNGSVAWGIGSVSWGIGTAAWDYRQILSHYYRKVKIGSQDNDNGWVWLNVNNNNPVFTGFWGEQYSEVALLTPGVLSVNQLTPISVRIQNTGDVTWAAGGASPVQLSYHWYDSQGATVVWDGARTNLSADVPPGGVVTLQAQLRAPTKAGAYTLKWDMLRGNTWFSAAPNNWPMHNAGNVFVLEQVSKAFLPHIINPVPVR